MDSLGAISAQLDGDTTGFVSWTSGRLVFAGTPLRDVVTELARWYAVEIRLEDPAMAARRITARVDDQGLARVLKQLALSLEAQISSDGHTITIAPKARPHVSP
jgi:transmembrane sensor